MTNQNFSYEKEFNTPKVESKDQGPRVRCNSTNEMNSTPKKEDQKVHQ